MNLAVNFACVGLGGALGACSRYAISLLLAGVDSRIPYATLSVNVVGALIAGFLMTVFVSKGLVPSALQLILVVGFLGGFTTFSAFSVETLRLLETGDSGLALVNSLANLVGSLIAVSVGAFLASRFLAN